MDLSPRQKMHGELTVEGLFHVAPLQPLIQERRTLWSWIATISGCLLIILLGNSGLYTSGDGVGYYLGLVGSSMMLVLFLYPLRKRVRVFQSLGPVKHWFALHMMLGIGGPLLILLHSTFKLGSLNAKIAFWSMVLVAGSGIIGRYIYRRIHHGLYGRQASLDDLRAKAGLNSEEVRTWLVLLPELGALFRNFSKSAQLASAAGLRNPLRFFALDFQARRTKRLARKALHTGLYAAANARGWDEATLQRRLGKGEKLIARFLSNTQGIAQFKAYERLFALWHILHVPFVYMLVFSAIAHIFAVHMY